MRSHLLEGKVRHRRARPFVYALEHDVYYVALDLDELDVVPRKVRLVSRNRPNLLSFRDGDHLAPPAVDLPRRPARSFERRGSIRTDGGSPSSPTCASSAMSSTRPASIYAGMLPASCRSSSSRSITPITNGICTSSAGPTDERGFAASMDKDFYVSPFIEMVGRYTVRVRDEPGRLRISINEDQAGELLLHTSLDLTRRPLTDRTVARMLVRHPFVTQKTIGLIHWHALRLWRRGAAFHRHGAATR